MTVELWQYAMWRVGSTYTRKLLELNFRNLDVVDDWKHGPHVPGVRPGSADGFVVSIKHPLSWIVSFQDYMDHPEWSVPERTWRRLKGKHFSQFRTRKWLQTYVRAYHGWLQALPEDRTVWVRYEDLLEDLEGELTALQEAFDLERAHDSWKDIGRRLTPGGEEVDQTVDRSYYRDQRWLQEFADEDIEDLLANLDMKPLDEPLDILGYDVRGTLEDELARRRATG